MTDLVEGHRIWFDPQADLTLVATGGAHALARRCGVPAERLRVVGLPVSHTFMAQGRSKPELRTQLGIAPDMATVLLVAGRRHGAALSHCVRHF